MKELLEVSKACCEGDRARRAYKYKSAILKGELATGLADNGIVVGRQDVRGPRRPI